MSFATPLIYNDPTLDPPFSMNELENAMDQCKERKAAGLNGIPFEFRSHSIKLVEKHSFTNFIISAYLINSSMFLKHYTRTHLVRFGTDTTFPKYSILKKGWYKVQA
ncbi:hypothetical protein ACFFRR_001077 [Megaselia abdita]